MKIQTVTIKNFLTIGDATINLEDRGLLLIQGKNADDTSADSNGAGKSSIADAICWAIYGVTARGVSTDAVVNKTAKKDCRVEVYLTDGKSQWCIARYRKDSTHKNSTLVLQRDTAPAIELHKGTERETQEVINGIVGCSLEVFQASVYAGQERMPDLPAMTDKQLKLMIEEAAGTEVLSKAHQIARERLTDAQKRLAAAQSLHESFGKRCTDAVDRLAAESHKLADYETARKPNAKAELAKTLPLLKRIDDLTEKIGREEALDRGRELLKIATAFAAVKHEQDELKRLNDEATRAARTLAATEVAARSAKQAHTDAIEALRTVTSMVGKPCGECGKAYCEHDIESVRKLREADVAAAEANLRTAANTYRAAKDAAKTASDAATGYRSSMTDVSALAARQRVLQDELAAVEKLKKDKAVLEAEVEKLKSAAGVWLRNDNPYTRTVAMLTEDVKALTTQTNNAFTQSKELEEQVDLLNDAVSVYGPAGVRAHILDTVTPYLNSRTSHYLSSLADSNIHAVWNTLSKNAKGEIKEKFSIEVTNDKGAESFEGLSGGEKRKVRLACAMALQDMVASRATKPIEIFIADEVDHALDESGLERLMTVLNDKAKERGTVLVISHSDLKDWVDNVITVTKEKGFGQVSGAIAKS